MDKTKCWVKKNFNFHFNCIFLKLHF